MEAARRIGELFVGKYRLERLLGVGGMGAVYEAVHVGVEKRFAIKLLKADAAKAPDSALRFTQEARAAARIGHANLVEVFDIGEAPDGTLYMVMELLVGRSLNEALRDGPFSVAKSIEVASALLSALEAAHRAGFVHRDIKPANIFLADKPGGGFAVKVLDFGIAKLVQDDLKPLTQSGVVVGTPLYMAPEQVLADKEVDGRADVWAVGAALFEMLTGRPVHLAPTATAAAVKVVTETAPRIRTLRADVDPVLEDLVACALSIDRAHRFPSAGEMLSALEACHVSLAPTLSADSGLAPSVKSVAQSAANAKRRRSLAVRMGSALVLGLVAGGVVFAVMRTRGPGAGSNGTLTRAGGAAPDTILSATSASPVVNTTMASNPTPSASGATTPATNASGGATANPTPPATTAGTGAPTAPPASSPTAGPHGTTAHPTPPATSPTKPTPSITCGTGEHASKGHCCAVGLVWQDDHCDRPLATEVTF